jgi:hypothetical protein
MWRSSGRDIAWVNTGTDEALLQAPIQRGLILMVARQPMQTSCDVAARDDTVFLANRHDNTDPLRSDRASTGPRHRSIARGHKSGRESIQGHRSLSLRSNVNDRNCCVTPPIVGRPIMASNCFSVHAPGAHVHERSPNVSQHRVGRCDRDRRGPACR